jgi:hypothetical protein
MRQIGRALGLPAGTVRTILQNRFYLGEVRYRNLWRPGHHPALIDPATFDAAGAMRLVNRRAGSSPPGSHTYAFGGLLTCAACGYHLTGNHGGRYYLCIGRGGHDCTQRMAREDMLVEQFAGLLRRLALPDDEVAALVDHQPAPVAVDVAALGRRLDRLQDMYEMGDIGRGEYAQRRDALRLQIAAAEDAPDTMDLPALSARLRDLAGAWTAATSPDRQHMAATLVSDMLVEDRRIVAIRPHPAWAPLCDLAWRRSERAEYYDVTG